MAKMIPAVVDDFNNSPGERLVFDALRDGLPSDYTVFHSFRWNKRRKGGRIEWGEADFTVFHPKHGILVIEVKSGGIALENGQWWYESTNNHERIPMKAPLEQADRTKYELIEIINNSLSAGEYCWVEPAVWFPSLDDRELIKNMPNTYHPDIVMMKWALNNTKQAIENAYNFYDCSNHTKLSPESAKMIIRTLAPAFSAIPSLGSIYLEQELSFLRITNEQNGLLDYLEEQPRAVIQGSAGTGKTLLAVEKARRLSVSDQVLFLCFNRFLMEDLRRKNQGYNISFYNLPSLVVREAGSSGVPTDEDIIEYLNKYDEIGNWGYKHIIVDEGQDFNAIHLSLLATISDIQNGVFYVFYDKNQLVQRRELPEWVQKAECRLALRHNCRNTHRIATTAGRPIDVEPILWEKAPDGKTPNFHVVGDDKSFVPKLNELISKYIEADIPLNQIVILTSKTEENSVLAGLDKIGKWPLVNARNTDGILFTTARKFKGLESAVVIIVDVNASTIDSPESRNLFYVGASRAKDFLDIIALLDGEQMQALGEALTNEHITKNVAGRIASTLKVRITR